MELNKKQLEALRTGLYFCSECGAVMEFEDEWEDTLVCLNCGHSIDFELYGFENEDEYNALFPTKAEFFGEEEEDYYDFDDEFDYDDD